MRRPAWLLRVISHFWHLPDARTAASPWHPCLTPKLLPVAARNWLRGVFAAALSAMKEEETAAHRVLAGHLRPPQQSRIHSIAAQRADVRIAPVARQHRQQNRSQHIPFLRCIGTTVSQWAIVHPVFKYSAGLQILNKEGHLPQTAHLRVRHPSELHLAREGIQAEGCFE